MAGEPVAGALPDGDPVEVQMAALRVALVGGTPDECYKAGRALWDAVSAALSVHRKGSQVIYASACYTHIRAGADPSCPACEPERRSEICAGCRDEDGGYLLLADCRVRKAVLPELMKGQA